MLPAVLVIVVWGLLPSTASAEITREVRSDSESANLVNVSPIRVEREAIPGVRFTQRVTIYNDADTPSRMIAKPVNLAAPEAENLLASTTDKDVEFGAGDWITVELPETILEPFEKVSFDVVVDPPIDAPVGSSYGGVEFEFGSPDEETSDDAANVSLRVTTVMQFLLTVPGEVKNRISILEANTRDSFNAGGTSFVSYGLRYRNDGNVTDHVKGKVTITSLFGNKVKSIPIRESLIIRGATRSDRIVWSDPPMFGIFTAEVEIVGDDGTKITKDMGRVILLPPWWLMALILAAIVLPFVYLWWRRRREWMLYMDDEDWDEDEDYAY